MTERQRAGLAVLPVATAVVLHLALAILVPPRFEVDSTFYVTQAQALVSQAASLDADGRPETRYPPGYPLFLAAFLWLGAGYPGAVAAQHVIWIAITVATVWLVLRASGSSLAATAAGLVMTLDLPGLQSSISILSDTLAAGTVTAATCATFLAMRADRPSPAIGWAACGGAMAGATALVRPIAIALGLPLAIAILIGGDRRWRWRAAAVLLVCFAVFPTYWTMRNARETGVRTLSSLAGINLLQYRAAGTLAIRDPGGIDANLARRREQLEAMACRDLEAAYRRPCASLSWAERSGAYADIAWPIILGDPMATAWQAVRALGMIVLGGGAVLVSEVTGIGDRAARLLCLAYTVPLMLLAIAGIPYWWSRHRALACLVLLVVGYMFGLALGAEAYSRFRVPVIALYAILSGGGMEWLRDVILRESKD
jgi:hypothetical protein